MAKIKGCRMSDMTYTQYRVDRLKNFGYQTKNGVAYDYGLCSGGAMFGLVREAHHTDEDIEQASAELRRDHDVVGLINIISVEQDVSHG